MSDLNRQHLAWKDRLRKEKHGVANSMTKGIVLDLIGSVHIDPHEKTQVIGQKENEIDGKAVETSPEDRKTKLLEYLIQQRRMMGEEENRESQMNKSYDYGTNKRMRNSRLKDIQTYDPYANNPLPITLKNKAESSNNNSLQASSSLLPALHKKQSYYLAHSVDLSHPMEYLNVKIKDHLRNDEVFYDNKKDNSKIHNRAAYSPDELKSSHSNLYSSLKVPSYARRNIENSKDNLFQIGYYQQQQQRESRIDIDRSSTMLDDISVKDISTYQTRNYSLPMIKSSSTVAMNTDIIQKLEQDIATHNKDMLMNEVMHPLRKAAEEGTSTQKSHKSKLENSIQKQASLQRMNLLNSNQKVIISKYKRRSLVNRTYLQGIASKKGSLSKL